MRGEDWRRGSESNRRIKVLQTSPLPLGYRALLNKVAFSAKNVHHTFVLRKIADCLGGEEKDTLNNSGAGDGGRTRDIDLGKVALYH